MWKLRRFVVPQGLEEDLDALIRLGGQAEAEGFDNIIVHVAGGDPEQVRPGDMGKGCRVSGTWLTDHVRGIEF